MTGRNFPQHCPRGWATSTRRRARGTYSQTNGGEFPKAAVQYLNWQLKGDKKAAASFVGATCGLCGTWKVQQQNLVP
jgi:hypothetical protein